MRVDRHGRAFLVCWCSAIAPLGATEIPQLVSDQEREFVADEDSLSKTGDDLWRLDQQVKDNPRAIQPHKRNYYTLSYFDSDLNGTTNEVDPFENELDHTEIKFQVSMRVPVVENMFGSQADLYTAYTVTSFWQALNSEISSPFREINHEPELFVMWPTQWKIGPILSRAVTFGFNHQSNGQFNRSITDEDGLVAYESASRSWNRIMLGAYFEQQNFFWHLQTWYRIPEEEKEDPTQAAGDDNPDIEDYLGNFELTFQRMLGRYSGSLMLRNNLDFDDNRGAAQVELSFPLTRKLNGMVQLFHGYGDSLLDYNSRNSRIGLGFTLRRF